MRALLISCLVALSLPLAGCGLRPLYANGAQGGVATMLADIDVAPIAGHAGWLVRNALRDRFVAARGGRGAGNRYRLDVRLEDSINGFGVRPDDSLPSAPPTPPPPEQPVPGPKRQGFLATPPAQAARPPLLGGDS